MSKTVIGHYEVGEELGSGGMGTVYLGVDTRTHEQVAIKKLHENLTDDEQIERFKREGDALRELNHPNIVKMLDAIEDDSNHYLIMEYVVGNDLAHLIADGSLSFEQILDIAIDLSDALTRAHRLNIIHRDLKPANILIGDDGVLKLTDFGVAHIGSKQRLTDTNVVMGTIDYLPPEVFNRVNFDERGDIWASGVILFELLTGERPFTGETIFQVIQSITTDPIPDLEAMKPDLPSALIDLVYRMLKRDYHERVPSVRIIGAELEAIAQGRDVIVSERFAPETPAFSLRPQNNLPIQSTPFVGRESELGELAKLITNPDLRLITILAPGGMGKTRLALETASRLQSIGEYEDGIYFIDLTPLSDADAIVSTIIDSISSSAPNSEQPLLEQLATFLGNKSLLLVMDNFEHLLDGAAIIQALLQAAPDIQFLVTSRVPLNLEGETLLHLSGMDFPDWETPEDALNYAAVKLFMNSALRALPSFELTEHNLQYMTRICRLVGGMPLGIVLAAGWLSMLSIEEIVEEIEQGISFLESSTGAVPDRQRSIEVVFEYSWEMLTDAEKAVFAKLSIFRGGFTRKAGQTITGASLRDLMSLVNKSLLRRDAASGRYSIHELARQYAYSKLQDSDDLDALQEAHTNYYAKALEQQLPPLKGAESLEALEAIDSDLENVRQAWLHGTEIGSWHTLHQMIEALWIFGFVRSREQEFTHLFIPTIEKMQSLEPKTDDVEITLALIIGLCDRPSEMTHSEHQELVQYGLDLAKKHEDKRAMIACLDRLSLGISNHDTMTAYHLSEEALRLARDLNDPFVLSDVLYRHGFNALAINCIAESKELTTESLTVARKAKSKIRTLIALRNHIWGIKDPDEYQRTKEEMRQLAVETKNLEKLFFVIQQDCFEALETGQYDVARNLTQQLQTIARQTNQHHNQLALNGINTLISFVDQDYMMVLEALHKSEDLLPVVGNPTWYIIVLLPKALVLAILGRVQESLGILRDYLPTVLKHTFRRDAALYAGIFATLLAEDEPETSVKLIGVMQTCSIDSYGLWRIPHFQHLLEELKSKLGDDAFEAAYAEGQQLDPIEYIGSIAEDTIARLEDDAT